MGHLEGCSGLASIVKSILILEKGVIPPVAMLEKINPDLDLRSGSVNVSFSFGFFSDPWERPVKS